MTKTKKQFLESYPLWSDSKRRKYKRVIFLKYGSQFLKTLEIAARNAQESACSINLPHSTQGIEVGESCDVVSSNEDRASSGESDPPVTDVEVLAPVSKLPDEIFSVRSSNLEANKGKDKQYVTVELRSPEKNGNRAAKSSQGIETVTLKGSCTTSSDSSVGRLMRDGKLSTEGGMESKVTSRRKKKAPKRIVKRQKVYEGDGDTSEESNADVRKKFVKISLDEEVDAGKEGLDWNASGDHEEAASVVLPHPQEVEEKEEGWDTATQGEGRNQKEEGAVDTSLIIDAPGSEMNYPHPGLLSSSSKKECDENLEYSSEGINTPKNTGCSIPKRKTARKKPGLSSLRSDAKMRTHSENHAIGVNPVLLSPVPVIDMADTEDNNVKDATSHTKSESENLEELKEKVLTGESPKLKVICSQVMPSSFGVNEKDDTKKEGVAALFHRAQGDILFDAGNGEYPKKEKGTVSGSGKAVDTPVIGVKISEDASDFSPLSGQGKDVPHQGTGKFLTTPQSMEVELGDNVTKGTVEKQKIVPPLRRKDDVEMHGDDAQQLLKQMQEKETSLAATTPPQCTEIEPMTSSEESLPVESQITTKKPRTTIRGGSLRQSPSKVQHYQSSFPRTKKKNQPKEGSKVVSAQKQMVFPPKQGPPDRKDYRKVAIPIPLTSLNTPSKNAEPDQEKTTPSRMEERLKKKPEFSPGDLVWGRMKGFPWWPGMIVHHYAMKRREPPPPGYVVIKWFGDMKFSQLKYDQVSSFRKQFKDYINMVFVKKRNLYKKALFQALKAAALQAKKSFGEEMPEFPKKDTSEEDQKIFERTFCHMVSWAEENFVPQGTQDLVPLPEHVTRPPTPPPSSPKRSTEEKASTKEKEKWVDCRDQRIIEMKKAEISLEEFCIGCGSKSLTDQHPLFVGGLCEVCRIEYLETAYMFADDGYQCYCCICAEGDELALCENKGCYRSFCITCMELLISPAESKKIKTQDPWVCYMCQPQNTFGYLKIRKDWPHHLHELFRKDQDVDFTSLPTWPPKPLEERKPVRVLSLFDGIGTGMFVLKELGFKVEVYVASEVNPDAIKVSSVRQKGTITQVGDVRKITSKELAEWGPFDLLIGGSPCNDLSIVNPARKGIYGGTGLLFFEYVRILRLLQLTAPPDRPLFWFFENVVFMGHQDKMTVSRFLECNPVLVDAKDVSPAHRARYFWGNLPGMDRPSAALVDSPLRLQDCLEPHCNRKAKFSKVRTITTRTNSLKQREASLPFEMDGKEDTLWCTELERLFGFPDHYTDVNNLSRGDRQKLLGQCWSVPVIHHLLAPLKDYYQCQ